MKHRARKAENISRADALSLFLNEFKKFADALPEPMLLVSGTGTILAVNTGLARQLKRTAEELTGLNLSEIAAEPSDETDRYIHFSSRTREPLLGTLTLLSSEGERKVYRSTGAVIQPKTDMAPAIVLIRLTNKAQTVRSFLALNQRINVLRREISAHSRLEERYHRFMHDMLFSVTEGKLILCLTASELPPQLTSFGSVPITEEANIPQLRHLASDAARMLTFEEIKRQDLTTAVSEAAMNAYNHAGGGSGSIYVGEHEMQVWVEDEGSGIAIEHLPQATLQKGFTTAGTLGHGFKLMLQAADRVWLCTGDRGTTVVIGQAAMATPSIALNVFRPRG